MDNSSGPVLLLTLLLLQNTSSPKASSPAAGSGMAEPAAPGGSSSRNHSLVEYGLRPGEIIAASVAWGALWLISVVGNSLICLVLHRSRRAQSSSCFVVCMACAELVGSVGSAPLVLLQLSWGRWVLGSAVCRLARYLQYPTPGLQVYLLLAISTDQCCALIHPLSSTASREKARRMALACWFCGALFAAPALFLYGSSTDHHCNFFLPSSWLGAACAAIYLSVLLLLIPSLLIILVYQKLFTYIWRSDTAGRRTMNLVSRRKVKTAKMFFIFVLDFLVSWLLFFMVQLWHPQETDYKKSSLVFLAVTWFSFSSSASKPILFYKYNANFRRGVQEICCMWRYPRSKIYTITTSSRTAKNNHIGTTDKPAPAQPHQILDCDALNREVKEHELARPGESNPTNTSAKRVLLF